MDTMQEAKYQAAGAVSSIRDQLKNEYQSEIDRLQTVIDAFVEVLDCEGVDGPEDVPGLLDRYADAVAEAQLDEELRSHEREIATHQQQLSDLVQMNIELHTKNRQQSHMLRGSVNGQQVEVAFKTIVQELDDMGRLESDQALAKLVNAGWQIAAEEYSFDRGRLKFWRVVRLERLKTAGVKQPLTESAEKEVEKNPSTPPTPPTEKSAEIKTEELIAPAFVEAVKTGDAETIKTVGDSVATDAARSIFQNMVDASANKQRALSVSLSAKTKTVVVDGADVVICGMTDDDDIDFPADLDRNTVTYGVAIVHPQVTAEHLKWIRQRDEKRISAHYAGVWESATNGQ